MKKAFILPIVMFIVFFVIDLVMFIVLSSINFGKDFTYCFLPAIFIEIAIYGSVILNEVIKYKEKKAEKKDEKQDEQITGNGDKK